MRAHRDKAAVEAYTTYLAPCADALLDTARRALDELPPARHLDGWRTVLDGLAASTAAIRRLLDRPTAPGPAGERAQHKALWPHLTAWADHGFIASHLADLDQRQQHKAPLAADEQQMWTERVRAAQRRGELELTESWYAADGQPITLAYLVEDDDSTVVALRGDPDAPGWQVIGHFAHEYEAGQILPAPVPPGVLRADVSEFHRAAPRPRCRCRNSSRASSSPSTPVTPPTRCSAPPSAATTRARWSASRNSSKPAPSSPVRWRPCRAGGSPPGSPHSAGRSSSSPARVEEAAEDLGATVAVLPPHRTPAPRSRPGPAVDTAPPAPPPRTSTAARLR